MDFEDTLNKFLDLSNTISTTMTAIKTLQEEKLNLKNKIIAIMVETKKDSIIHKHKKIKLIKTSGVITKKDYDERLAQILDEKNYRLISEALNLKKPEYYDIRLSSHTLE